MSEYQLGPVKSGIMLLVSFCIVLLGVMVIKAPSVIVLFAAGAAAIILGLIWGVEWKQIEVDIYNSIRSMLPAIMILLLVGMLVGSWLLSGTIPVMVYYGLQVLSPPTFLLSAVLICTAMSVMAGTSWGTLSTVGVALMGVSAGLGIPLPYTAGAVVVGAIFGDKLSPLSDTTVLASAVAETDIVEHIRYMLYTTVPGYVISLGLYLALGLQFRGGAVGGENLELILTTLRESFNLSPVLLLPPLVVLALIIMKKPALPVFAVGIILGCLLALLYQGEALLTVANTLRGGYANTTGVSIVDNMLRRGGLNSMLGTVALIISAVVFGSPLRTAGVISSFVGAIARAATGRGVLVGSFLLHGLMFMLTGSYYVTFSVLGPMLRPLVDSTGLHRVNLSRILEDTGTAFAPVVPWSVTGAFVVSTLGVTTGEFVLYAPMTWLGLVFSLIYILTGWSIRKANTPVGGTLSA